ncbi:precorrin-2 dehydrogenase/sirohydrochlorin ferrochelatase family protein [Sphingomonas sp. Y38-1Y]|uniref:precorrin-2 dehydrogenase/sirohydrochlorin ferrochelatase family protein n=1 Tax=Sphingomonas sp. Y38-1Y TaxID=3078265 RepID=UPI0028E4824A|nr:NAD(P)-dependent oxidoreductase [Sphingomonas sp. Y38-1Y]
MRETGLPIVVRLDGKPVILLGEGEAADAKRRLLERAGAMPVEDHPNARLAIVALEDEADAVEAAMRLKARGLLVNVVDRPALCDFTLPAIVDRSPVLVAVATGGASAGLAAALRQRIEAWLPAGVGSLASALSAARGAMRTRFPEGRARRTALASALAPGGVLDPLGGADADAVVRWLADPAAGAGDRVERIVLTSADPDNLTLRAARLLADADRVCHRRDVPAAILSRARADAERVACDAVQPGPGLTVDLTMAADPSSPRT